MSRFASISTATTTITAPSACWKRPLRRERRRVTRRPPSINAYSATADPVRECGDEPAGRERLRGRQRDHAGEDRPGTRRVDHAEPQADDEAGAEALAAAALGAHLHHAREPRLEPVAHRRHGEREAEADQTHDRDVPEQVVREAERLDHVHERDGHEGERHRKPRDDPERAARASRGTRGERDRQHGQHAWGQRGADARDEREQDQQDH
jgi:hypothetical protein